MVKPLLTFNDVSLTDGQTAVWSGGMTTPMIAKVIGEMDNAKFSAIEVISSQTIVQCLQRGEDPWQRLEVLRYQSTSLEFRASINLLTEHGYSRSDIVSADVMQHLLAELANRNVSQVLIVDPLLQADRLQSVFEAAKELGMTAIGALPFMEDDTLDDQYFSEKAAQLHSLGAERIMLRDEGGVLTPDRVAKLIPVILNSLNGVPLILHTRCVTGLGPLVAIDAVRLGIAELDTALPVLANGPSLPSSKNIVRSLDIVQVQSETPDLSVIAQADACLCDIAERENFDLSQPWVFDLAPFIHQLPGDVAAMVSRRLHSKGERHLLHEYASECALIRADLGSPPMISPFANCIAEQAFANLDSSNRYAIIVPGVRRVLQGIYGEAPQTVNLDLLDWVGAVATTPSSSWADLSSRFPSSSDEARLTYQLTGVVPQHQPMPCRIEELLYDAAKPLELLQRGLAEYAQEYFYLSITGPDVNIQYPPAGVTR